MDEALANIVTKIKHIIKNHRPLTQEQTRDVTAWLERFLKLPHNESERSNMIKYAKYLEYQLKSKNLRHPFDQPPPKEIADLSILINEQLDLNESIDAQELAKEAKCKAKSKEKKTCDWDQNKWMQTVREPGESKESKKRMNECKQILNEASKPNVILAEFMTNIVPLTEDKGETIREVVSNELKAFRELVFKIFTDKTKQVDRILSAKQCVMKKNYTTMEQQLLNRAKIAQNHLKQLLPGFNYNEYLNDNNYIRNILLEIDNKRTDEELCEPNSSSPESSIREQQFKLKFLRDEVRNREERNDHLMDEYNNLMGQLNQTIKEQQEKSKEMIKRNKDLKDKLAGLNITAEENQKTLDKLLLGNEA